MLKRTRQAIKNNHILQYRKPHWKDINPPDLDTGHNIQQTINRGWRKQ